MASIISHSAEETFALGRAEGARVRAGDVLALAGDLGAGKTQWVKGLAAGLACTDEATSPTFTLLHEYRGGRLPLYHGDCYRLNSAQELLALGLDEYTDGVLVLEWADKFPDALPASARWLRFRIGEGDEREIEEA